MHGSRGDSGRRVLYHSQAHDKKFRNGQCDVFEIEAVSLDDIQQIDIGHENKGKGQHAMVGCLGFFHVQLCSKTVTSLTLFMAFENQLYCVKGDMILHRPHRVCGLYQRMATMIWVNIGSGNGLLPDGTKPILGAMLIYH